MCYIATVELCDIHIIIHYECVGGMLSHKGKGDKTKENRLSSVIGCCVSVN